MFNGLAPQNILANIKSSCRSNSRSDKHISNITSMPLHDHIDQATNTLQHTLTSLESGVSGLDSGSNFLSHLGVKVTGNLKLLAPLPTRSKRDSRIKLPISQWNGECPDGQVSGNRSGGVSSTLKVAAEVCHGLCLFLQRSSLRSRIMISNLGIHEMLFV